jgi:signal peptidase I
MARRIARVVSTLVVAAGLLLGALLILPAAVGWQRYVIVSGSMTGTYDRGSLLYDRVVPTSTLEVGDVITYDPPQGAAGLVTHRIASIAVRPDGTRVYRTKGDANPTADPWTFTLTGRTQARAAFHVPYAGFALAALSDRRLRMLIIGVPALLVAISVLAGLWRDAGEAAAEARRA